MPLLWYRAQGSQRRILPPSPSLFPISFGSKRAWTSLARTHDMATAKGLSASTRKDEPASEIAPMTLLSGFTTNAVNAAAKASAESGFAATWRLSGSIIFFTISATHFVKAACFKKSPKNSLCFSMNCVRRADGAISAHREARIRSFSSAAASASAAGAASSSSSSSSSPGSAASPAAAPAASSTPETPTWCLKRLARTRPF